MFGIEEITQKINEINKEVYSTAETFQVDDISVTVSNYRIDFIEWENEPNPEELKAAINQTLDNYQERCLIQTETKIKEAVNELSIPKAGKQAIIAQLFGEN